MGLFKVSEEIASVKNLGAKNMDEVVFEINNFDCQLTWCKDKYGNFFIKIPTLFRRIDEVIDGQITAFSISFHHHEAFEPYPIFVTSDGKILEYVYIEKKIHKSSCTLSEAKEILKLYGENYELFNWQYQKLLTDLFLIMSKKVSFKEGVEKKNQFLGFEDLDYSCFVDGVNYINGHWIISYDSKNSILHPNEKTKSYKIIEYRAPNNPSVTIKKLGYDCNNPFFNYPCELEYFENYCYYANEYLWMNNSEHPVITNMGDDCITFGLFNCNVKYNSDRDRFGNLGFRLCSRNLEEDWSNLL